MKQVLIINSSDIFFGQRLNVTEKIEEEIEQLDEDGNVRKLEGVIVETPMGNKWFYGKQEIEEILL